MMTVWDRRNPRVAYQVPVGVIDVEKQRLFSVTSVNVSEGGMFVDSQELLTPGAPLVCNVPLESGRSALQLEGRVAWIRPRWAADEHRPHGMGIEFVDVSDEQSTQLRGIVGDVHERSHSVRLSLQGLRTPINARAKLMPEGIYLRAPLPFLQLGAEVDFCFDDDNMDSSYRGRIANVGVHVDEQHPVPRLQVEVELTTIGENPGTLASLAESGPEEEAYEMMMVEASGAMDPPQRSADLGQTSSGVVYSEVHGGDTDQTGVPEAIHAAIDEAEPLCELRPQQSIAGETRGQAQPESDASATPQVILPAEGPTLKSEPITFRFPDEGRRRWYVAGALSVVSAVVLAALLWPTSQPSEPGGRAERGSLIADPGELLSAARVPDQGKGGPATAYAAALSPIEEEGATAAYQRVKRAATQGEPRPSEKAAPRKGRSQKPLPTSTPTSEEMTFEARGSALHFRLPIEGSSAGANHYMLADPPAIAVNLPNALPRGGFADERVARDGIRLIWVRERLGGTHWRIFFEGEALSCDVELGDELAEIRCRR